MKTLATIIKEEAFGQGKDGMYPPLSTSIVRVGPIRLADLIEEYDRSVNAEIRAQIVTQGKLEKIINYLEKNK